MKELLEFLETLGVKLSAVTEEEGRLCLEYSSADHRVQCYVDIEGLTEEETKRLPVTIE
jgi:hypothetical protein